MDNHVISVIGLGYVGLPVALAFGRKKRTIGFDNNPARIDELNRLSDINGEVDAGDIQSADILFTSDPSDLKQANFHIIAVPTPVDDNHRPDLSLLIEASKTAGAILKRGDIVVYESTVYPGVTEDVCVPVLEQISNLKNGRDFKVGYSPERINPGDEEHTFSRITKVVSGQDQESLDAIASVYGSVISAGVHKAGSIKTAEAAKVIENTQRDLNIALMNELSLIFDLIGLDTKDVLAAAATKWNFLPFQPGLVGGHCIGVDSYYLTHTAEAFGYIPEVILAGRRINDGMGKFIAQQTIKEMIQAGHKILNSNVAVLGLTFKENCSDIRNSKTIDLIDELRDYGINVQVHDALANKEDARREYGIELLEIEELAKANAIVVAVAHDAYRELNVDQLAALMGEDPVLIDVKGIYSPDDISKSGIRLWRL